MKYYVLIIFIVVACNNPSNHKAFVGNPFTLLEKHMSHSGVTGLIDALGADYEFNNDYGTKHYIYDSIGIELSFTKTDTLEAIFIKKPQNAIQMPYKLNLNDTRKDVIQKLGEPDKNTGFGVVRLTSYYLNKEIVVSYENKDTSNHNNPIRSISFQKIDSVRLFSR